MSLTKKIGYGLVIILVVFQFFRIDKTNPVVDPSKTFLNAYSAPENVRTLFRQACFDCHSNETVYPWYTNIAPVSWWIKHHVNEGREEMNLSEWADFSERRKNHKLKKMKKALSEGWMPLDSYKWMHDKARLTKQQRKTMADWVAKFAPSGEE